MALTSKQRALHHFLRSKHGFEVQESEILVASGYKPTSWSTFKNNGYYKPYLEPTRPGYFQVHCSADIDEKSFCDQLTQSKNKLILGCKNRLARSLMERSRDNAILAFELYNRPSLQNRIDGFVILFCTAWEQLLKALVIEQYGEAKVYSSDQARNGQPKTIMFESAMALL